MMYTESGPPSIFIGYLGGFVKEKKVMLWWSQTQKKKEPSGRVAKRAKLSPIAINVNKLNCFAWTGDVVLHY